MSAPRHPESLWFWPAVIGSTIVAIVVAILVYRTSTSSRSFASLGETAREQIAALDVRPVAIAEVEREWVKDGFEAPYLMAPVGPEPCAACVNLVAPVERSAVQQSFAVLEGGEADRAEELAAIADASPTNLLVALMLATELVRTERYTEAERVITQTFDRTGKDEEIILAARRPGSELDLDDHEVSTIIHLHHALGVARLSQSGAEPPWKSLKNVIGSVKQLSRRRLLGGTTKGQAVASKLLIAAPGCGSAADSLTSYDLFNNLIVGYARGKYADTDENRAKEFFRESRTYPSAVRLLFLAQLKRETGSGWKNEAQLWALSNAEQVLDWRRPDDARLSFNIIQLLDWWTSPERCPKEVCADELIGRLGTERDALLELALRRRNVTQEQQPAFAAGVTRMIASSGLDRAKIEPDAQAVRAWLPAQKMSTLDDLIESGRARTAFPQWVVGRRDEPEPPFEKLGRRADRWRDAALRDFAAATATWASTRAASERRQVLIATRQLLGGVSAPPAVMELEAKFSWLQRLLLRLSAAKVSWMFVAFAIAAIVWLILVWILMQVREWRSLRVSFYNVELDHLRGQQRDTGRR